MENKKCRKCGIIKPISEFYTHPKMLDGHLNVCKDCVKKTERERYNKNTEKEGFYEKERIRGREKYRRLYAGKTISHIHKENSNTRRRFASRGIDISGKELHHWNYNEKDAVFLLTPRQHKKVHKYLTFDESTNLFRIEGKLIDTMEKHREVLMKILNENPTYVKL